MGAGLYRSINYQVAEWMTGIEVPAGTDPFLPQQVSKHADPETNMFIYFKNFSHVI
jgi:hypothetical protein